MWVRRTGIAAVVAVLVVLIGAAAPAGAVSWKKPVDPYPDLPSAQYATWVQTADGPVKLSGYQPGSTGWAEQQAQVKAFLGSKGYPAPSVVSEAKNVELRTGKVPDISSLPKQLTAPSALTRGASGSVVTGAFMVGWGITDGVLAMYGAQTGENPLDSTCGWGAFGQSAVAILYPLSSPDCSVAAAEPNPDSTKGWTAATYNGASVQIVGSGKDRYNTPVSCASVVGFTRASGEFKPPLGASLRAKSPAGVVFTVTVAVRDGGSCGSPAIIDMWAGDPPVPQVPYFVSSATGEVVGTVPVQTTGDPLRTAGCEIAWSNGSTTSGAGGTYRESSGVSLRALELGCASAYKAGRAGATPTRITTTSTDGDSGAKTVVQDATVAPGAAPSTGDGSGLRLFKRAAGGALVSCMTWEADCAGWWQSSSQGQSDTDYACTYGGAAVALSECYVYERTFEDQTATKDATITDPATGDQTKWSSNSDALSTDPSTGPSPADECWDSWASAPNPIEWVFHPVQCALVWAFAPRQSKLDTVWDEAMGKWSGTMPGQIVGIVQESFSSPTLSGCDGLRVFIPLSQYGARWSWQDIDFRVLDACTEPGASVALWARLIGSAVLIYYTGLGIVRRASATVNAPGIGGGGAS